MEINTYTTKTEVLIFPSFRMPASLKFTERLIGENQGWYNVGNFCIDGS